MTRREAPSWVSSSPSGASSAALKRVSIYSLTKRVGTEIVRDSDRRSTATTSSNHTLREEASISPSAFFSRRAQRSSAAGSGVGGEAPRVVVRAQGRLQGGLQGGFQGFLVGLWWLREGVALADGANEEAGAVADALLDVEGLGVAQAPLGTAGDDEVPCGVSA